MTLYSARNTVTIRRATPDDAQSIGAAQQKAWRDAYSGLLPAGYLDSMTTEAAVYRWASILRDDHQHVLVAHVGDRLAGFANVGPSRDHDSAAGRVGEIYAIYLLAPYWDRGIGRMLCDRALTILADARFTEVILWVLEDNQRGRRFYEKAGFSEDGMTRPVPQIAPDVRIVRYHRSLPAGP